MATLNSKVVDCYCSHADRLLIDFASGVSRLLPLPLDDAADLSLYADQGSYALGWLDPDQQKAVSICHAFIKGRRGERLRLQAVASDSRFRAGQAPSSQATAV